jgi:hypothetical protein
MSEDWSIRCMDCSETHGFSDANHMSREMAILCKHAAQIVALKPLSDDLGTTLNFHLSGCYGGISIDWFAKHAGHRIVPYSEYGNFMDQCHEYVSCTCGSSSRCTKQPDHEGDHDITPRK